MAGEISRTEIDGMIEACIQAVNEGTRLPKKKREEFDDILDDIGKSRGLSRPDYVRHSFDTGFSPQGILLDAAELGLVTKKRHREFLAKRKILIDLETSLIYLAHTNPAVFRRFVDSQKGKSIDYRWLYYHRIFGLDFDDLINLQLEMAEKRSDYYLSEKDTAKKQRLKREWDKAEERKNIERDRIVTLMAHRLTLKFTQPDARQWLVMALRNKQGQLSKRELEILLRTLEALDRTPKRKPTPRKRLRRLR